MLSYKSLNRRMELTNEMVFLASKVNPLMTPEEILVIQTEIDLLRDELNALPMPEMSKPGRRMLGVGKPVKITLPEDDWMKIEKIIEHGHASSVADYFRQLHQNQ